MLKIAFKLGLNNNFAEPLGAKKESFSAKRARKIQNTPVTLNFAEPWKAHDKLFLVKPAFEN